jgi:hypothetical protein
MRRRASSPVRWHDRSAVRGVGHDGVFSADVRISSLQSLVIRFAPSEEKPLAAVGRPVIVHVASVDLRLMGD